MSTRTLPGIDRDWLHDYLHREYTTHGAAYSALEPEVLFANMPRKHWRKLEQAWEREQTVRRILQKQHSVPGLLSGGLLGE